MTSISASSPESPFRHHWQLDPEIAFLNHGSFGACPVAVLEHQRSLVDLAERDPVLFFNRQRQPLLDYSRKVLAEAVEAAPADLVFDTNATHAINAVLRWIDFKPGDEILVTNHGYNAVTNAARYVAEQTGATVTTADVPLPVRAPSEVTTSMLRAVTPRTRLAIIDHITSPTAIVLPLEELIPALRERNVRTLVDGAHGPGAVPLHLEQLSPDYYVANCHKWFCSPRGAAFLYARHERRTRERPPTELQPASVSHGYNTEGPQRNRFHDAFDFPGTTDPTAWASVGPAIEFLRDLRGSDLEAHIRANRQLALRAAELLLEECGLEMICPPEMIGPMVTFRLPDERQSEQLDHSTSPTASLRLHSVLREQYGIQVPVCYFPHRPHRLLRISAQAYNSLAEYRRLAAALRELLEQ